MGWHIEFQEIELCLGRRFSQEARTYMGMVWELHDETDVREFLGKLGLELKKCFVNV